MKLKIITCMLGIGFYSTTISFAQSQVPEKTTKSESSSEKKDGKTSGSSKKESSHKGKSKKGSGNGHSKGGSKSSGTSVQNGKGKK